MACSEEGCSYEFGSGDQFAGNTVIQTATADKAVKINVADNDDAGEVARQKAPVKETVMQVRLSNFINPAQVVVKKADGRNVVRSTAILKAAASKAARMKAANNNSAGKAAMQKALHV